MWIKTTNPTLRRWSRKKKETLRGDFLWKRSITDRAVKMLVIYHNTCSAVPNMKWEMQMNKNWHFHYSPRPLPMRGDTLWMSTQHYRLHNEEKSMRYCMCLNTCTHRHAVPSFRERNFISLVVFLLLNAKKIKSGISRTSTVSLVAPGV